MTTQMPAWLRHDNLCQYRRSQGVMSCDCQIGRRLGDDPYALLSDDQRALMIAKLISAKLTYRVLQHEAEDNLDGYNSEQAWHQGAWSPQTEHKLRQQIAEYQMMADELMDLRWEL